MHYVHVLYTREGIQKNKLMLRVLSTCTLYESRALCVGIHMSITRMSPPVFTRTLSWALHNARKRMHARVLHS